MSTVSVVSFETLSLIGVFITSLLIVIGTSTVARSVLSARQDRQRADVRPQIQQTLLKRMEAEESAWEAWVSGLSETERHVTQELLEEYLHRLRGRDRESLQQLGYALGIDEKARQKLHEGDHLERRWALHWVARLDIEVTIETLEATCGDHPETRAAAARVLYEQDRPNATAEGTALLLRDTGSLSVLGVDTLYQLNKLSPSLLFTRAKESYDEWSESRLIQVLQVIGNAGPASPDTPLEWTGFLFVSESPNVRVAAANALVGYGWHSGVRSTVEIEQVRTDDAPRVRRAVYEMLGDWEDMESVNALLDAARTESDPRAAIDAISALDERATAIPESELSPASSAARDWVLALRKLKQSEAGR